MAWLCLFGRAPHILHPVGQRMLILTPQAGLAWLELRLMFYVF
ncbi:hypothetical protein HALA3H3_710095 [Halomonas sp. A3H3]|nr:hypothetical protein HALA3H3_710095 [Halomonas sp. A3H3]